MQLSRILSFPFIDEKGLPLDGGKVFVYISNSGESADTYSDHDGTSLNEFPVKIDARGSVSIYVDGSKTYDIYVYDVDGRLRWNCEKLRIACPGGGGASEQYVDNAVSAEASRADSVIKEAVEDEAKRANLEIARVEEKIPANAVESQYVRNIVRVKELPTEQDPNTLYIVVEE